MYEVNHQLIWYITTKQISLIIFLLKEVILANLNWQREVSDLKFEEEYTSKSQVGFIK